jgi:primosomal protein N' (replication factor Y) (superfamily II helicase)
MPSFVAVAVLLPTQIEIFHYHLPVELENQVLPGHLVEVPFGKKNVYGIVCEFVDHPAVAETRPITTLVDPNTVLLPAQLTLARQLSETTLAPLSTCLQLMLPPGLAQQADTLYTLNESGPSQLLSPLPEKVVTLLRRRGPLRGRQIDQAIPHLDWRGALRPLITSGWIAAQPILPPPSVKPKSVRTAALACPLEQALEAIETVGKPGTQALSRRQAILRYLLEENGAVDVSWLYAASGGRLSDLHALADLGLVLLSEAQIWRDPLSGLEFTPTQPLPLIPDQQAAWQELKAALHQAQQGKAPPPYLLHGVTGSGKTEIYLHAVAETLRMGRQAIILVPEIAMTPQTVSRFVARFPGRVGLYHSQLSTGERYDTWLRARAGKLSIIIGPRSALFTPFPETGLIILDECHDESYYQAETPPYYHAVQAATIYAELTNSLCLLGSATPDVQSRYKTDQGRWRYLNLPARILAHRLAIQRQMEKLRGQMPAEAPAPVSHYQTTAGLAETTDLPPVIVVDMRQELKAGNRSIFSRTLQTSLLQTFQSGQQSILFMNRRGTATHVFCRDCGWVVKCPRCDIPLTYHTAAKTSRNLICHRCNYQRQMPVNCPQCRSSRIRQLGLGTEKVEAEVRQLIPEARTLRWDYETTRKKGAHELILAHFQNRQADILIGTQMIAKGLDLPLVTLVGVVLADAGLNLPDLRASERTFAILTQVAGRAGRSPLGGKVVLQTFDPDHYVIQAASQHDYETFYRQELSYRKDLSYPPFSKLVKLEYKHPDPQKAERAAQKMASNLRQRLAQEKRTATELIGPAPCFFSRIAGSYRWQILLRGPDPAAILRGQTMSDWKIEVDPPSLL